MKKNYERQQEILLEIEKKFTFKTKEFIDGYFIFEFGEDSVCHFSLEETPEWTYGIWLGNTENELPEGDYTDDPDERYNFKIFGEHVELIDKFKPSRTYVSFTDDIQGFIEEVKLIQENPKLYFVDSLTMGDALYAFEEHQLDFEKYYTGYQVKREYNEKTKRWDIITRDTSITQEQFVTEKYNEFYAEKAKHEKEVEHDRQLAFKFFDNLLDKFEDAAAVGVKDKNKDGCTHSPRYEIDVVVLKEMSDDDLDELVDDIYNYTRESNYSGERLTYEHQFSFEGLYGDMSDIEEYDFKYYR